MQHLARLLRAELVAAKGEVVGALWSLATQETCATAIVQEDKLVGCAPSTGIPSNEPCSTGPHPRHASGPNNTTTHGLACCKTKYLTNRQ